MTESRTVIEKMTDIAFVLDNIAIRYEMAIEAAVQHLKENNYGNALSILQSAKTSENKDFFSYVSEVLIELAKSETAT